MSDVPLPKSLLREGRAMLCAIVDDLLRIPGCHVVTTLDRRLVDSMELQSGDSLTIQSVSDTESEHIAFDQITADVDAVLIIAPETDGLLARRVQRVIELGAKSLNCLPTAIEICGDKLLLAEHFSKYGIATIPTKPAMLNGGEELNQFETGCVLKPRDGAGSWLTFAISHRDSVAWQNAVDEFVEAHAEHRAILQPLIAGQALSVGCVCNRHEEIEVMPVARQHLAGIRFQYRGGTIPAGLTPETIAVIERLVRDACQSVPGLRGYIGVDLLLPDSDPQSPLVVEINPRLTTSYVGYRESCRDNLGLRLLQAAGLMTEVRSDLRWIENAVSFAADGTIATGPQPL